LKITWPQIPVWIALDVLTGYKALSRAYMLINVAALIISKHQTAVKSQTVDKLSYALAVVSCVKMAIRPTEYNNAEGREAMRLHPQ
jgi:hypothetical protein